MRGVAGKYGVEIPLEGVKNNEYMKSQKKGEPELSASKDAWLNEIFVGLSTRQSSSSHDYLIITPKPGLSIRSTTVEGCGRIESLETF
jgi:hypothetical protein